jgi:hypothetical protein
MQDDMMRVDRRGGRRMAGLEKLQNGSSFSLAKAKLGCWPWDM